MLHEVYVKQLIVEIATGDSMKHSESHSKWKFAVAIAMHGNNELSAMRQAEMEETPTEQRY